MKDSQNIELTKQESTSSLKLLYKYEYKIYDDRLVFSEDSVDLITSLVIWFNCQDFVYKRAFTI